MRNCFADDDDDEETFDTELITGDLFSDGKPYEATGIAALV